MKTKTKCESCSACEILYINNIRCHEHGCPNAWKDTKRKCFTCGFDFIPEARFQNNCPDCIADAENFTPEEVEE